MYRRVFWSRVNIWMLSQFSKCWTQIMTGQIEKWRNHQRNWRMNDEDFWKWITAFNKQILSSMSSISSIYLMRTRSSYRGVQSRTSPSLETINSRLDDPSGLLKSKCYSLTAMILSLLKLLKSLENTINYYIIYIRA